MKKYLLIPFLLISAGFAKGQTCAPDQNITTPGHYPDALPTGLAGEYYEEVVQFNIPADTEVVFQGNTVTAQIDSIKVIDVQGLPSGLAYGCTPATCALPGGQTSCGIMFGTIDESEAGTYPFVIPVRIYVKVNGVFPYQQLDTIFSLSMDVAPSTGIGRIMAGQLKAYPNPAGSYVNVSLPFSAPSSEVIVYDRLGRELEVNVEKEYNRMKLDVQDLTPGMYYGMVFDGKAYYRFHFIRSRD